MESTKSVTIRLGMADLEDIKASLKGFGCKSMSQFVRQACEEKLARFSIGQMVEAAIQTQEKNNTKLNLAVVELIKVMVNRDEKQEQTIGLIAENLSKIAVGFENFSNQIE
jgi:hypothetical protein